MNSIKYKLSSPDITNKEIRSVNRVLKSTNLSLGPMLRQFEKTFAKKFGYKYAVAVSSGTAGLHCCIRTLNIGKNDEVITTPFSFISSSNCMLFENAKPVFVDINEDDFNINPELITKKINKRTKAILPVHVFGVPCDMKSINNIARKHRLSVIEDACEAIGAKIGNKYVGKFSDISVFAFYPNKQMTTGEGGMVVTDNKKYADNVKSLINQGRNVTAQQYTYEHIQLGYNYRISDINSAIGNEQVKRIDTILTKRNRVANYYIKKLKNIPEVIFQKIPIKTRNSWFVFVIRLHQKINRDNIIRYLIKKGIQSAAYFNPIHLQAFYRKKYGYKHGDFPITEKVAKSTLALPFYNNLKYDEIDIIVNELKNGIIKQK